MQRILHSSTRITPSNFVFDFDSVWIFEVSKVGFFGCCWFVLDFWVFFELVGFGASRFFVISGFEFVSYVREKGLDLYVGSKFPIECFMAESFGESVGRDYSHIEQ